MQILLHLKDNRYAGICKPLWFSYYSNFGQSSANTLQSELKVCVFTQKYCVTETLVRGLNQAEVFLGKECSSMQWCGLKCHHRRGKQNMQMHAATNFKKTPWKHAKLPKDETAWAKNIATINWSNWKTKKTPSTGSLYLAAFMNLFSKQLTSKIVEHEPMRQTL